MKIGNGHKRTASFTLTDECVKALQAHLKGTFTPMSRFVEGAIWKAIEGANHEQED